MEKTNQEQIYFHTNKTNWDKRVQPHLESKFYDMPAFLAGKNVLGETVLNGLGDVNGKSLLHLQCHFGQDSLCWARLGARVTGADISGEAIKTARELNSRLGLDAQFVESNIYDLKANLDGQFDLVFTSYGTTVWLPDLDRWADIIHHFLKPGGQFFIADFHPALYIFDFNTQKIAYPYFNTGEAFYEKVDGSYTDGSENVELEEYFWNHSLHNIFQALLKKGLQVVDFQEYDYSHVNCFPNQKEVAPGKFVFGDFGVALPHEYSLKVQKPLES